MNVSDFNKFCRNEGNQFSFHFLSYEKTTTILWYFRKYMYYISCIYRSIIFYTRIRTHLHGSRGNWSVLNVCTYVRALSDYVIQSPQRYSHLLLPHSYRNWVLEKGKNRYNETIGLRQMCESRDPPRLVFSYKNNTRCPIVAWLEFPNELLLPTAHVPSSLWRPHLAGLTPNILTKQVYVWEKGWQGTRVPLKVLVFKR